MKGRSCVSPAVLGWFKVMLSKHGYRRFLEIGTFDGCTIANLAEEFPEKDFETIDDFSEGNFINYFENNKGRDNVTLHRGKSHEVLRMLRDKNKVYDLAFVDGEHSYHAVRGDFRGVYPMVKPGGVIAFHDQKHPEVAKAIVEGCFWFNRSLHVFDEFLSWIRK